MWLSILLDDTSAALCMSHVPHALAFMYILVISTIYTESVCCAWRKTLTKLSMGVACRSLPLNLCLSLPQRRELRVIGQHAQTTDRRLLVRMG